MQKIKKLINRGLNIIALFSLVVLFTKCAKQKSNDCDLNDNVCCTCTATYISVDRVAATEKVCSPSDKQNFLTIWTDPLVSIDCRR